LRSKDMRVFSTCCIFSCWLCVVLWHPCETVEACYAPTFARLLVVAK